MTGQKLQSLEDLLAGTRVEGREKTASSSSRPVGQQETDYATELAMLEKFAQENFTQDDMLKIAASSKISGEILAEVQIEKLASAMPILVKVAMEQILPHILPGLLRNALTKIAVGDSDVMSGDKPSNTVEDHPHAQTLKEDEQGKGSGPSMADGFTHANMTEGASADGSGSPESKQGDPISNTQGNTVGKMAALRQDQMRKILAARGLPGNISSLEAEKRAQGEEMMGMGGGMGGGGDMEQMLQMIMQKMQQGIPLSPEEQAILEQAQGSMGGGGGGGMQVQASARNLTAEQKQYVFEQMLRQHLG